MRTKIKIYAMKYLTTFIYAILAGVVISIGGITFLVSDSKIIGSLLFSVGLFAVCTLKLNLYTGSICYLPNKKYTYLGTCCLIWFGNLIGTFIMGSAVQVSRLNSVVEKSALISETKLSDTLLSIFVLSVLCNILIYLAVENFKNNPHEIGKYLGILFGITVFVIAGFEHCVANMFYFSVAGIWSSKALLYIIIMTMGNTIGGIIFPLCKKLCRNN